MATTVSASAFKRTEGQHRRPGPFDGIRAFWRDFIATAFGPYRPELHYMRGPGPAWHAKHDEHPPAIQEQTDADDRTS